MSNVGEKSGGRMACIQREVLLRQVSAHLTNGAVSTVSTVSTQAGARFCHIYCPPPRGSPSWAWLADWAGIIWTKKLKYARIYILQQPGPAQLTAVGGG